MRASAAAESAGIPSVSIVCEGFEKQANATGNGLGYRSLALAVLDGHVDAQSYDDMIESFVATTVDQVVSGLTVADPSAALLTDEPAARDVIASGTLDEILGDFDARGWTGGLPIVPPTIERVEAFIEATGHDPFRSLGTAKSSGREMTVWSIAVNGVMAGCRPAELPVLLALAEILADPQYGMEHSGNTTGADAIIVLDGPVAAELGFNAGPGALRDGVRPNTSVGRWLRLFLRNVGGFTSDQHDKATFGNSFRVVLAEDMATLDAIGWEPLSSDFGYGPQDDVAMMARMNSGTIIGSVVGSTPDEILPYLADGLTRTAAWDLTHVYGLGTGHFSPLLVLSPILARVFSDAGWSKGDVRLALFEHARIPAWRFEKFIGEWSNLTPGRPTLAALAAEGKVPPVFGESTDPDRLVPIVTEPDRFRIAVAGDPNRTNAYALSNDGPHGWWTAARIDRSRATDLECGVDL